MTPPHAAIRGSMAWSILLSAPSWISRRISMPTTRKNRVISASLTQKCSGFEKTYSPSPIVIGRFQKA